MFSIRSGRKCTACFLLIIHEFQFQSLKFKTFDVLIDAHHLSVLCRGTIVRYLLVICYLSKCDWAMNIIRKGDSFNSNVFWNRFEIQFKIPKRQKTESFHLKFLFNAILQFNSNHINSIATVSFQFKWNSKCQTLTRILGNPQNALENAWIEINNNWNRIWTHFKLCMTVRSNHRRRHYHPQAWASKQPLQPTITSCQNISNVECTHNNDAN